MIREEFQNRVPFSQKKELKYAPGGHGFIPFFFGAGRIVGDHVGVVTTYRDLKRKVFICDGKESYGEWKVICE